jgi:hypothetical protein
MAEVMSEVFAGGGEPEFFLLDGEAHQVFTRAAQQAEWRSRLFSPAGLGSLFVGLKQTGKPCH